MAISLNPNFNNPNFQELFPAIRYNLFLAKSQKKDFRYYLG